MTEPDPAVVTRLVGVYDADHTLRGELQYWVGARLGRAHCALCDVTHGVVRAKRAWHEYRRTLPVPFDTYHRDDQPDSTRILGAVPAIAVETAAGTQILLGPEELGACGGSVEALGRAVSEAVRARGLRWPGTTSR
jgi:hypothetical protein